jgi:Mn2+/Fe2+ NRAMP family transporter
LIPSLPHGDLSTIVLLICAIVGTTVAPWQLFFQQSYVIDKRITPRFVSYERWDLVVGIGFVLFGAFAIFSLSAGTFVGTKGFGGFQDAGAVASGIAHSAGYWPAVFFALALMDAAIIGAAAVSLSTAYALGDVLSFRTSLHHKVTDAPAFYAVYLVLIALAAAIVLIPGSPLGLLTNAVQVLAGVLLPSATVFLLLLCNDKTVLGPWSNSHGVNVFTGVIIALLVVLSLVLTCSTLFPQFGGRQILWTLVIGIAASLTVGLWTALTGRQQGKGRDATREERYSWHMPPLHELPARGLSPLSRGWLGVLRLYLVGAIVMVVYKVALLTLHRG